MNTYKNTDCAETLNNLSMKLGQKTTDIPALMHGNESLVFASANINVDASTSIEHTERDQGYTEIAAPYQEWDGGATFIFRIRRGQELHTRLTNGRVILFNARLLTHKQRLDRQSKKLNGLHFWNFGCYGNRQFESFSRVAMRRQFDLLMATGLDIL